MGEIADMLLDGTLCQFCGVINEDILAANPESDGPTVETFEPQGFPWTCAGCKDMVDEAKEWGYE